MENYVKYLEYVVEELLKIDTEYSNSVLERVRSLNLDNSKNIVFLVSSVNNICSSKIQLYWLWSKRNKI